MAPPKKRHLRAGFTTGAAAAAAARGALMLLTTNRRPDRVRVFLLTGDPITIAIHDGKQESPTEAWCTVIKDAGDDPDITHRATIGARVTLLADGSQSADENQVLISGGIGVGRVTKPGLEVPPGEPAINPGPRKMIRQSVVDVLETSAIAGRVCVEVFVPNGRELAEKTLNARLGIIGGISILGTTGIVRPMSHDAYVATIESALSVAHACGLDQVVMTTGRRSERHAQNLLSHLPEEAFVQIGDFFKLSLERAAGCGFRQVILTVFFGKALKMAHGVPHTHAAKSSLTLNRLADWALSETGCESFSSALREANTARHALGIIKDEYPELISCVGEKMVSSAFAFAGDGMIVRGVIFDFDGTVMFDSRSGREKVQ